MSAAVDTAPPHALSYAAVVRQQRPSPPSPPAKHSPKKMKTSASSTIVVSTPPKSHSADEFSSASADNNAVRPLLNALDRALQLELKYRGSAQPALPTLGVITSGMRDGSAHVLRCLKVWYDLPTDVFFGAVSNIDRFLAKMKAQPKHLACIAVSSFHLACVNHRKFQEEQVRLGKAAAQDLIAVPEPPDLVTISQSRCSPSDLMRMEAILAAKLEAQANPAAGPEAPVTALSLLRQMFAAARAAVLSLGLDADSLLGPGGDAPPAHLVHQLEILACDTTTLLAHRPSEVALALLATDFRRRAAEAAANAQGPAGRTPQGGSALLGLLGELQKHCRIAPGNFAKCLTVVVTQLEKYNGEGTVVHRQRLVWKLSNRTLRHLRPTDKLRATLPTIKENANNNGGVRLRSNSESSDASMEFLSESDSEREMDIMEEEEPVSDASSAGTPMDDSGDFFQDDAGHRHDSA